MRYRASLAAAFFLFVVIQLAWAQPTIALRNVNVIAMTNEALRPNQTVVVRGERIAQIGSTGSIEIPENALVIDGTDRYVMPGLAEMHAHVPDASRDQQMSDVLFLYVANGITTARGMLGMPSHLSVRERIARHELIGPRLLTSGPSLSGQSVATPEQAAQMIREQAAAGYDFIKLHPGLSLRQFESAVLAAQEVGMPLAGHVSADVGVLRALESRQATIDHLDGYIEALATDRDNAARASGFFGLEMADSVETGGIDDLARQTAEAGVWIVPTQSLIVHWAGSTPDVDELARRPEMRYVSASTLERWTRAKRQLLAGSDYTAARAARLIDIRKQMILQMHEHGVGLLLGSDAPQVFNVPGFSIHRELELIVEAGLSPFEALSTGTKNAAEFFGMQNEFGVLQPGMAADLLLLDDNPLESVSAASRPVGVMLRGMWLDRATLDTGLAEIAERGSL